jgi:hypothetical protein
MAVGSYVVGAGPSTRAIVETYDGSSWTMSSPPVPAGATSSSLDSVSCIPLSPTTMFCAAVGRYTDAGGTQRGLLETWNGTAWTVGPTTLATGLAGVSCLSKTSCVAVGQNAAKLAWNGTTWVSYFGQVSGASLNAVSCRTVTLGTIVHVVCSAVGSQVVGGVTQTLAQNIDGATTTTETTPTLPGVATVLSGISCTTPIIVQCFAVGTGGTGAPFAVQGQTSVAGGNLTWTTEPAPGQPGSMTGVACIFDTTATPGCRAVGTRVDLSGHTTALFYVQG